MLARLSFVSYLRANKLCTFLVALQVEALGLSDCPLRNVRYLLKKLDIILHLDSLIFFEQLIVAISCNHGKIAIREGDDCPSALPITLVQSQIPKRHTTFIDKVWHELIDSFRLFTVLFDQIAGSLHPLLLVGNLDRLLC